MGGALIFLAVVFLAAGFACLKWAHKRVFERTNAYGVQEFDGHGKMVKATAMEAMAKVVGGFAIVGAFFFFIVGLLAWQ